MTALLRAAGLLALAVLAPSATAQPGRLGGAPPPDPDDLVTWTVDPVCVVAGEAATLRLGLTVAPGWHVYALDSPTGIPLTLDLGALPAGVRVRAVRQSEPIETVDPAVGDPVRWFEGRAHVEVDLAAAVGAAPGAHAATATVRFGVCDDRICLPPQTRALPVPLEVTPAAPAAPTPAAAPAHPEAAAPQPVDSAPGPIDAVRDVAPLDSADPGLSSARRTPAAPPPADGGPGRAGLALALAAAFAALLVWRRRRAPLS